MRLVFVMCGVLLTCGLPFFARAQGTDCPEVSRRPIFFINGINTEPSDALKAASTLEQKVHALLEGLGVPPRLLPLLHSYFFRGGI